MTTDSAEVCERLNRLARSIGRVFGTDLGVDESGDRLIFCDADGEPIMNDGDEIIAATPEEIADRSMLGEFPVRAFRAAVMTKYLEIEKSRTP